MRSSDWSSDVCSSDLEGGVASAAGKPSCRRRYVARVFQSWFALPASCGGARSVWIWVLPVWVSPRKLTRHIIAFFKKSKEKRKFNKQNPLFKRRKFFRFTEANIDKIDYKDLVKLRDFSQENGHRQSTSFNSSLQSAHRSQYTT